MSNDTADINGFVYRNNSKGYYGTGDASQCTASMLERVLQRLVRCHLENHRTCPNRSLVITAMNLNRHVGWRCGHPDAHGLKPTIAVTRLFEEIATETDYATIVRLATHLMVLIDKQLRRIECARYAIEQAAA